MTNNMNGNMNTDSNIQAGSDVSPGLDAKSMSDPQDGGSEMSGSAGKTKFQMFMAEWLPYIIFFIVVLLFRITILINAVIPTESMVATIQKGDHVIGLKSTYWFSEPQRGDIVVFHAPDTPETLYIKRVIGTPGDTVVISNGKTYINGKQIQEDYLPEPMIGSFGPYVVPEGSWFMLGDNRNHSLDARYWDNTWVTKDLIVGKAYFRYWPPIKWLY